jgi:anti-anti-sigma factor
MIDIAELRRLRLVSRIDFWIAVAAIIGVLSVGVLAGVAVGVVLSLGWLVYVAATPQMPVLGREPGTNVYRELDEHPGDETVPGIVVVRLDSGLFFATAEALDTRIRDVIAQTVPPVRSIVLNLEGVDFVDSQGAAKLTELNGVAHAEGVVLRLARVKPQVLDLLELDGVAAVFGEGRIHGTLHQAVDAQLTFATGAHA